MKSILATFLVLLLVSSGIPAQDGGGGAEVRTTPSADAASAVGNGDEDAAPAKLEPESATEWTNSVGLILVKVNKGLWSGMYEVTQEEYEAVMGSNPSAFRGERRPVDSVSWNDAAAFTTKLTEMDREKELLPEGYGYALPTEKQWLALVDAATLENAVTSKETKRRETAPVGSMGANALGLYDTRGNVWEWVLDGYDPNYNYRILRGGAWDTAFPVNLRIEFRHYAKPSEAKNVFGFRVVLVEGVEDKSTEESGAQRVIRY